MLFEVSPILDDDSTKLVFGGANGFVKVSLSNSATSLLLGCSTFVEVIGEGVVSLFGEVLGEGASLSIEVEEEEALAVSGGGRVAAEMGVDTTHGGLKYSSNIGLPKLKYVKDQLCSSCEMSKAKRSSFKSKAVPSSKGRLNLLHMDLSKDETPEVLKDFLTMIQRNLQAQVIIVRTDRGTEFLNKTLHAYFKEEGIEHQTSTPQTPE
ncbi:retrovirus-related pol polyprotein from transposon TNT 1-94 [Tanacetum coccineum]